MNEKHVKISIQEEVIDHGKKRKERKYKSKINPLYIGLFGILLMAMVMSHDIKTISNEEAETNETVRSDLVKAKIAPNEIILVGMSDKNSLETLTEVATNKETEGETITQQLETTTQEVTTEEELITESVETEVVTEQETEIVTEEETTIVETETEVNNDTEMRYNMSADEWDVFTRIVEAEVTGNDPYGVDYDTAVQCKLHVAQVILNRVESEEFPDNIIDVVTSPKQFSPVSDGRFYSVVPSEATIEACNLAVSKYTPDTVYGATYFRMGGDWSYLNKVFTDDVGHQFYTE